MKPAAQTKLLSTQERSEIMSRAMKTWWANRKAAEAKAERKAKREAKKAAASIKDQEVRNISRALKREVESGSIVGSMLGGPKWTKDDTARVVTEASKRITAANKAASGVKVKLPRGTQIKDGKVKLNKNVGRPLPAQYAAKTKRTWKKAG